MNYPKKDLEMADTEQTMEEKAKIFDILRFTPCTYKIRLYGYGGEVVLGEIERKIYDYFRVNRLSVIDYSFDWDYAEDNNIPEEFQPFEPGSWNNCNNLLQVWGVSRNGGTLEIEDENGEIVYTRSLDELDGMDVQIGTDDDACITMKGPGSTVYFNYSAEKGTFFEGDIKLTMPFNPEKLYIEFVEIEGDEIAQSVSYDDEYIDNYGGDTSGKGSDPSFFLVKEDYSIERYQSGDDLEEAE